MLNSIDETSEVLKQTDDAGRNDYWSTGVVSLNFINKVFVHMHLLDLKWLISNYEITHKKRLSWIIK